MAKDQREAGHWRPAATHTIGLSNGSRMEIGVFEDGAEGVVVTQTMARTWGGRPLTKYCLWCSGKSIGCVECTDRERIEADCIRGMIRCIPKESGGEAGIDLGHVVAGGVDVWPVSDGEE